MMLPWIILIPFLGGLLAWGVGRWKNASRWVSLSALFLDLCLVLISWGTSPAALWRLEYSMEWIPQWGIGLHLGMDGLSLILVCLTLFLGVASVISSWTEIREKAGFFHANLLFTLTGVLGIFLSLDLFLFAFFWELMLLPMYLLISLWGHENRVYAAMKFFLFTQLSGLLMFAAILGLFFFHGKSTGVYTFDYQALLGTKMAPSVGAWLMLGFFAAFAVKLPVIFLHTWLPDAHTEAPTAGSVILAGLLLKTGAYGMIRFMVPLFPDTAAAFAPFGMGLAVAAILYGAVMAFGQRDLKRLVAYTSISHMGFVLLGVSLWTETALRGAVMQMVCHGLSTGGLFIIAGSIQERLGTREMARMGGLRTVMPWMAGMGTVLAVASLGLPGLGNFVGEFLVLIAAYPRSPWLTALAAAGLIAAAVYSLALVQRVFDGPAGNEVSSPDASPRELAVMLSMIGLLVLLGLYPRPVLDIAGEALKDRGAIAVMQKEAETAVKGEVGDARP